LDKGVGIVGHLVRGQESGVAGVQELQNGDSMSSPLRSPLSAETPLFPESNEAHDK
jgi:hypothetical protein